MLATDLSVEIEDTANESYELAYSSRTTPPEEMAQALLASSAISAFVLPMRVGDRIASDGGWVRNFPLGYAYERPEVELIVSFRYLPRYPQFTALPLQAMRRRLERLGRVPPVRAFIAELKEAEERADRGEPAHLADMLARLGRVSILRNTVLEERTAREKDESIAELESLRADIHRLLETAVHDPVERAAAVREVEERFAAARFPFRHDRRVPRIAVLGSLGDVSLDPGLRSQKPWTEERDPQPDRARLRAGRHRAARSGHLAARRFYGLLTPQGRGRYAAAEHALERRPGRPSSGTHLLRRPSMRNRIALVAGLLLALGAFAPNAFAGTARTQTNIHVFVDCVTQSSGTYDATFGYKNDNSTPRPSWSGATTTSRRRRSTAARRPSSSRAPSTTPSRSRRSRTRRSSPGPCR